MTRMQAYILDIRKAEYQEKSVILLFGKTIEGNKICLIDEEFKPFFYCIPNSSTVLEKLRKIEIERDGVTAKITNAIQERKKILGKEINAIKIYVENFNHIELIKEVIGEWEIIDAILEDDIPYARKYIKDNKIHVLGLVNFEATEVNANFRVPTYIIEDLHIEDSFLEKLDALSINIEAIDDPIDMAKNPIDAITFYLNGSSKTISWKRTTEEAIYVNSEVELVERALDYLRKSKYDIIVGFNTDEFGLKYIIERANKYKISLNLPLDGSKLGLRSRGIVRTNGIPNIDLLKFIKNTQTVQGGYHIDNIVKVFLKEEISFSNLINKSNVLAELTYRLSEKFLPSITSLAMLSGIIIDNVVRMGQSQIVEAYIINNLDEYNELIPKKPDKSLIAKRFLDTFEGGFVFEPKPGVYENIVVFDFRSLYPSIIATHNISPDKYNCACCDSNFCQKEKGFMAQILENLIRKRIELKEKTNVDSIKLLANSFYGYLGFYGSRWYMLEAAKEVTMLGRKYITEVINKAKTAGFEVIYSDTDSVFISLNKKTQEDSRGFLEQINGELPGLMALEFEGLYSRGLFVGTKEGESGAKKKYALLSIEGELKIKGFASIRVNWSKIGRRVQYGVINLVLKEGDIDRAKEYVKEVITDLENEKIEKQELIIETTLQKNVEDYGSLQPHVVVAKKMIEDGIEVKAGTKIRYIITPGEGKISERARIPKYAEDYDADYYINNQILQAVDKIFDVFGYDVQELNQKKLEDY